MPEGKEIILVVLATMSYRIGSLCHGVSASTVIVFIKFPPQNAIVMHFVAEKSDYSSGKMREFVLTLSQFPYEKGLQRYVWERVGIVFE